MRTSRYNQDPDRVPRSIDGVEASRRAAWAMYYTELERSNGVIAVNAMLRERVTTLLEWLIDLTNAVLDDKNLEAFAAAYRIREAMRRFEENN